MSLGGSAPLFLCIDGGGSKTRAVIARRLSDGSVSFSVGEAGPSNLTYGASRTIEAVSLAVHDAVSSSSFSAGPSAIPHSSFTGFTRVWAGIAGCARPSDFTLLRPLLAALFPLAELHLTNDAELLTASIQHPTSIHNHCVALICGTGSLAMHFERGESGVRQLGRSGGWGSLLGDEGSGWSMGRKSITSVLAHAANGGERPEWHSLILQHFGVEDPADLIRAVSALHTALSHEADSERRKRIAACSRVVMNAEEVGDREAAEIMRSVADEVVGDVLGPLVSGKYGRSIDPSQCVLVVGGGLGQAARFWRLVQESMQGRGWGWGSITHVVDPAQHGVLALLSRDSA